MLFTLVDSGVVVYRNYVGGLSRAEEAAYWKDYRVVGRLFGLRPSDMPRTLADLDDYRRAMLGGPKLHVTPWARERARAIVLEPPVPLYLQPLVETANFITIALLPDRIRDEYGFSALPPRVRPQGARPRGRRVRQARGGAVPAGAPAARAGRSRRLSATASAGGQGLEPR